MNAGQVKKETIRSIFFPSASAPRPTRPRYFRAASGIVLFGGKQVSKGKVRVNSLVDAEVVAYFKSQAGGRGYQTLINEALKASMRDRDLESTIRRIIREELRASG